MSHHVAEPLVSWEEIQDIELVVLRRMREYAMGAHPSVFQGHGFDLVGLREWQPGDRPASIDWPQSTITNFSPLMTREFEQESTASLVMVADTSLSTRCGTGGIQIAKVIARTVATIGMAGAFFQDLVGLVALDGDTRRLLVRPRVGKNHAIHCVEVYQEQVLTMGPNAAAAAGADVAGLLRKRSLIPVITDLLVDDPAVLIKELVDLHALHDLFVVMVDSRFAFELPGVADGWVEGYDVESGKTRLVSASELASMAEHVGAWQDANARNVQEAGLDVVRVTPGQEHEALAAFLRSRRERKR